MSSAIKEVPVQLPHTFDRPDEPWHHYLTIDLIWYVLGYTLFHPFVSWVLVLCLRAQYTPYENIEMRIAMGWALLMTAIGIFGLVNDRIAFGSPREVDLSEEVIVITGGVDGLGGLLAETYGMRNANIAVLDVKEVGQDEAEEKGVTYYQCDVSDATQVEAAAAKIVEDVSIPSTSFGQALTQTARAAYNLDQQCWHRPLQVHSRHHRCRRRAVCVNDRPSEALLTLSQHVPRKYTLPLPYSPHLRSTHVKRRPWYHCHRVIRSRPPWVRQPLRVYRFQGSTARHASLPSRRACTEP